MVEPEAANSEISKRGIGLRIAIGAVSLILVACFCGWLWLLLHPKPSWPGWVGYTVIESPNYNDRPIGEVVNCIILHSTAQPKFTDTIKRFQDPLTQVSSHFVVDRDGKVVQMVPLTKRAWHAGVSSFDGVEGVNDYSIGIEMTNMNDGKDPYPEAQYKAVAEIIRRCRKRYDIPDSRIVSHALVALPKGRKTDPEGFDFAKVKKLAAEHSDS